MNPTISKAIELAGKLLTESERTQTGGERAEAAQMAAMMEDPAGKAFTLQMVDRVFRSSDPRRQAGAVRRRWRCTDRLRQILMG